MQRGIKIAVIVVIVAAGVALTSPLFFETEINEPLPTALDQIEEGLTFDALENMDDEKRQDIVNKMPEQVKDMVMEKAATMTRTVSEGMDDLMDKSESQDALAIIKTGKFEGLAGHEGQGIAKIISVGEKSFLRFEDFKVTNGPALHVYMTQDGDVQNGINLGKLKGSSGAQNYVLADDIDTEMYSTAVVYCKFFGVYFAEATLN